MGAAAPSRPVQYDARTDAVVYGPFTRGFERADWIRLAAAALDQAGDGHMSTQAQTLIFAEPENDR
jgi:hypothetical protein